jgi:N6-adenosine-specific RNA methylase IME4
MTTTQLATIDQARQLLEQAATVGEVKDVRDRAEALRQYARQASLGLELQNTCAELKVRAERKAGEMLAEMPKLAGARAGSQGATPLADLGVNKHQSRRWQLIAALPEARFEQHLAETRDAGREITSSAAIKLGHEHVRRARVADIPPRASTAVEELGPFDVLYIDPPWRYDDRHTTPSRAVENNYPTMSLDELQAVTLPANPNSVLLMWATSPKLADAVALMAAWGFTYRTNAVWVKDRMGMGNWFRQQHELLLVGRRGNAARPDEADRPRSIIEAPRGAHSAKPPVVYELIEQMFPGRTLVELFARETRAGWASWGNEIPAAA